MRFVRTNTATRITVGPFLDKTDGITPEVALTVTACHLTLVVDTGGVPTLALDADATASGGSNDMVHVASDDAGFYDLELTAAQLNYVGRAMLSINDVATHCPVFHELMILPANVYDSLVGGTDLLQADVTQAAGSALPVTTGSVFSDAVTEVAVAAAVRDVSNASPAAGSLGEGVKNLKTAIYDSLAEEASRPAIGAALYRKWNYLFGATLNKQTHNRTTGVQTLRNDADAANVATSTTSDDGTVFTRGRWS